MKYYSGREKQAEIARQEHETKRTKMIEDAKSQHRQHSQFQRDQESAHYRLVINFRLPKINLIIQKFPPDN